MNHLLYRSKTWYFNRRVPLHFREYDDRHFVRFSLKTDSRTQAEKLAALENAKLENYWENLYATGKKHGQEYYRQVVDRANILGFPYLPTEQLATGPFEELVKRLAHVEKQNFNKNQVEAVMGGLSSPIIKLDDALTKFWGLTNDIILSKSPSQIKKWKNPRRLAMKNLISCIGNKALQELTRDDLLKFRDWWLKKIEAEGRTTATANKNFIQTKTIISRVSENYKLNIDVKHIFNKLLFEYDYEPRPPFSTEQITNVLLNSSSLKGMNEVYQGMLKVFAETGVCFDEQAGILQDDIFLNEPIPYISIRPRTKDKLKTKYRKRSVPLTGFALETFKKFPNGFSELITSADSASAAVNKYLRENELFPTERHSVYSLRHSFQDRLLSANCPDRIQADLMGHKFQRPTYGEGGTLDLKLQWLEKIRLF